jgi:hypothetical protein
MTYDNYNYIREGLIHEEIMRRTTWVNPESCQGGKLKQRCVIMIIGNNYVFIAVSPIT